VKAFFDTSVLVALFKVDHVHHAASYATVERQLSRQICCSAHSLAEVYSSLTRMPPPNRTSPERAILFVTDLRERLNPVALESEEIFEALCDFAETGITGGAICDGLQARCALKAKADVIYTWNVRDFERIGPEVARRIRLPAL
jgi:predicted nucleic acid-binding protein